MIAAKLLPSMAFLSQRIAILLSRGSVFVLLFNFSIDISYYIVLMRTLRGKYLKQKTERSTKMKRTTFAVIASDLRAEIAHLLVDLGVPTYHGQKYAKKLATVLSAKGVSVSTASLSMALNGYRSTPPYIGYLAALKAHLVECQREGKDPMSI